MNSKIYLDYNATTPVDQRVLTEMLSYFTAKFGNASSISHAFGWDAEEGVELARDQIAKLIKAKTKEIYFTSGATEAMNLALQGVCKAYSNRGNHLITCQTEHRAVLDTCKYLEQHGIDVTYLPVDPYGNIDLDQLQDAFRPSTIAACLMHANNEIGTIHPLAKISKITQSKGVLLITDATQSVGKIPIDVKASGIDMAAFSAHKMYGPKGVGALYVNSDSMIDPILFGGGQEKEIRPGTLNVPGIVGFGKAAELCKLEMDQDTKRLSRFIEQIECELEEIEGVQINGNQQLRLPHMTNISVTNIDGTRLVRTLKNLAVSQGSACTSNTSKPSHVLKALGLTDELGLSSLRIGLGRFTTETEVKKAILEITEGIEQLKLTST